MPPKKKVTVAKKRPSNGGKVKTSKAKKSKNKAMKRKSKVKQRRDKQSKKQRKERKKTEKAKRTAKKATTKKTKKKTKKKKKQKAEKKAQKEKPEQELSNEEADDGNSDETTEVKFVGMTVNQMQNLRTSVTNWSKDEFLEQIKKRNELRNDDSEFQEAYMTSAENRMNLFYDVERPTDPSAGPFQSNRFGAVFLIPE